MSNLRKKKSVNKLKKYASDDYVTQLQEGGGLEKLVGGIVIDELGKLYRNECLYEGEVVHLAKQVIYDYNMHDVDLVDLLNNVYGSIYRD